MVRVRTAIAMTGVVVSGTLAGGNAAQAVTGQWYKADLHVHSVFSADAFPDLGIIARSARAAGFNAIFLTDHNMGSNFSISGMTANQVFLPEAAAGSAPPRRWTAGTAGSPGSTTEAVVTSPVASSSSTSSVHLASTSSTAGESFIWTKRGPQLRASDAMLSFAVDVKQLTGDSGVYVSASIGGDPTIKEPANNPVGYTTASGTVSPGKSNVLVWYFGAPPPATFYGSAHVVSHPLTTSDCDQAFATGTWLTCTVDLTAAAKNDIPAADQPLPYDALSDLKMAAVGNGGTADAYFDNYSLHATSDSAEEFVYRNSIIDGGSYDTPGSFMLFPSVEMGTNEHAQRFNFDIKDPSQFTSYANGIDGIAPTQATGYPAQLNHPGVPGGVTDAQAVSTDAEGADLMEVRQQNMINDWDAILRSGHPLVGTWGGDNHIGKWTTGSQATEIWAPSLDFDALTTALRQGQIFLTGGVSGMTFNLDGSSTPYPAATPVSVPSTQTTQSVHLSIAGGLKSGDTVKWLSNQGSPSTTSVIATDTASGTTYAAAKSVPISGSSTYVRAEVWRGTKLRGMTEAIMFVPEGSDSSPGTPPTDTAPTDTTLSPVADTYVNAGSPSSIYGTKSSLRVDASPDVRSYLQFDLTDVTGTVIRAVLRVWATSSQRSGYTAVALSDPSQAWSESSLNYSNAPPISTTAFGSSGPVTSGTWTSVDVTGFVTKAVGGVASLALTTPSSTALALASRESGANAPQLVLTTG